MRVVALGVLVGCGSGDTAVDPAHSDIEEVHGDAKMIVTPTEIVCDHLIVSVTYSGTFEITSTGDRNLDVSVVDIADSGANTFTLEEVDSLELPPDTSREFTVRAALEEDAPAEGQVRIRTNDSDNLDYRLPLTAYPRVQDDPVEGSCGAGTGGGTDTGDTGDTGA